MDPVFMPIILESHKEISSLKWLKCKASMKISESMEEALDSVLVWYATLIPIYLINPYPYSLYNHAAAVKRLKVKSKNY